MSTVDLGLGCGLRLAAHGLASSSSASLKVAALTTTEGGGFGFSFGFSFGFNPCRCSPLSCTLGLGVVVRCCRRAGSGFLTGSTSTASLLLSNSDMSDPVGCIGSASGIWSSNGASDTTLLAPRLDRLVTREWSCVAESGECANPLGFGVGEPVLLAASVAAIYDADGLASGVPGGPRC